MLFLCKQYITRALVLQYNTIPRVSTTTFTPFVYNTSRIAKDRVHAPTFLKLCTYKFHSLFVCFVLFNLLILHHPIFLNQNYCPVSLACKHEQCFPLASNALHVVHNFIEKHCFLSLPELQKLKTV